MLNFNRIKTTLEKACYSAIEDRKGVIVAYNVLGQERRFKLSKLKSNYYILKATGNDFMMFENADNIQVFELEFKEEEVGIVIKIRDFLNSPSEDQIQKIYQVYGA